MAPSLGPAVAEGNVPFRDAGYRLVLKWLTRSSHVAVLAKNAKKTPLPW